MKPRQNDYPDPDAALLIDAGVGVPPAEIARIAKMHRAASADRSAIRALRLGETEPVTIFAPLSDDEAEGHE